MPEHGDLLASRQLEHIQSLQKYRRDVNLHENLIYVAQDCVKGVLVACSNIPANIVIFL